jgi:hypothetical protein
MSTTQTLARSEAVSYKQIISEICDLSWTVLNEEDLIRVAWAYYHFSVQFRECLQIARDLYPEDERLLELDMASATPITFRHGRAWPRSGRK